MGLKSDCGGGQRGVAVPQVLEQSRASQGHWGAVLAEVCRGHHDDDDDYDNNDDDDDYDNDYDDDDDDDDKPAGVTQNRWKELSWLNLNDEISSRQTRSDHIYYFYFGWGVSEQSDT